MKQSKLLEIDEHSGAIRLLEMPQTIDADTTRESFAESPLGAQGKLSNQFEPFRTFNCRLNLTDGESLVVQLQFCESMLAGVTLCLDSKAFGESWGDWTMEKEMQRKARHDEILAASGVENDRKYKWGAACSFYDERSGGSSIYVSYSKNADAIKQISTKVIERNRRINP